MFQGEKKLDVRYEKFLVTKSTLVKFKVRDYRRNIRSYMVAQMYSALLEDRTFQSPIHVNLVNGVFWIIDGNHRIEALMEFLEKQPEEKIEIPLAIHENLSVEEEKTLYDELANTINQNLPDIIKIHFDEVPFFSMVDNNFPVRTSIYSSKDALNYPVLLSVFASKDFDTYRGVRKKEILKFMKNINKNDYVDLKDFFMSFKKIFGEPAFISPYYKRSVLWIIMSVYFRNRAVVDIDALWSRIKKKGFNNVLLLDASKQGSAEFTTDSRRLFLEKLNKGWKGTKLV